MISSIARNQKFAFEHFDFTLPNFLVLGADLFAPVQQ
jgi:hypothetical protein